MAAAKRIGKIDVDHGATSCKTPDAIPYMKKVIARLKTKKKPAKKRKKAVAKKPAVRKKRKTLRKTASSRRAR